MPPTSGVKGVRAHGNGWIAECSVDGELKRGSTHATIEEAKADYDLLLQRQKDQRGL